VRNGSQSSTRRRSKHYRRQNQGRQSELYQSFLPVLNSARVALPDNARLISQLCSLERRTARGGRDSIDHPPGGHDDLGNVVAGLTVHLSTAVDDLDVSWVDGDDGGDKSASTSAPEADRLAFARQRVWAHVHAGCPC
jgi:hypothetical protein